MSMKFVTSTNRCMYRSAVSEFLKHFLFFFRKSECGEAIFQFRSKAVLDILASIKKNIYLAISLKKAEKTPPCLPIKRLNPMDSPIRTLSHKGRDSVTDSITSITSSEQGIRDLLESPSKQAEKRIRMMSECSQATSDEETVPNIAKQVVNKTSIPEIIESSKDDSNVHGEMGVVRRTSIDILSEPIETNQNSAKKESDYYKIDFKAPATPSHETVPIISTITVARPGYQTNLLLDERGYSHVNLTSVKVQKDISKTRSLSNNSNRSSIRSASTGSKDSGIINQMPEKVQEKDIEIPTAHPSTNSFDSAVSTSSTVENLDSTFIDTKATKLSVEIEEVEVTVQCDSKDSELERSTENCIYQDVSFGDSKSEVTDSAARPKLKKSNSTGYFKTDENPYEELDKYRKGKKDLVKHLGMDPKVDPSSVPPSLPDRPLSHKMKRKFGSNADKKLFTLPFAKGKSRKNREKAMSSTSSDSDSESGGGGKKRDDLLSMKVWPLGDTSVAGSNDLYQPVAIERFLNDQDAVNEKITRERSCSLNLNRTPDMKRPSISSANVEMRGNKFRHHGRNASLTVELLGNDPNIEPLFPHKEKKEINDMLKSDIHSPVSQVPSSLSPTDSFDYDSDSEDDSAMRCGHHDDEPVYAEVMPVGSRGGEGEVEEPFPNMDEWKPQNMSDFERNELDETNYENDESGAHSPVDLFNMGFVSKDENIEQNQATTGVLIDLDTEIADSDKKNRSLSAFDIFNATNNTSFMNQEVKALDSQPSRAEMNQALMDIFSLGAQTPLPQSSTDLWKTGTQYQTTRHEQSALLNGSTSGVSENWADFSRYTPVETRNNWADFSQFDSSQRDTGNTVTDSIYMDMSNYKNESIYVMPSEAKRQ